MTTIVRASLVATSLVLASVANAQTVADPSGHWEGSISAPFGEVPIVIDIARRDGHIVATYSRPDGSLSGFPLSNIEVSGSDVKLALNANGGGRVPRHDRAATDDRDVRRVCRNGAVCV